MRAAPGARSVLADLREGAAFAWGHALLRPILLTAVVWNLSWFVLQAAYVPFALERLGLSAAMVGLTMGAYGAGMVAGAMLAGWVARVLPFGAMIAMGPVVSVAAGAAMLGTLVVPGWVLPGAVLPLASFFLFGAGPILWTIGQTTLRQAVTPEAMLGRVSALMMMATFGARPVGAALGAVVGLHWGLGACVAVAFAGFCVQAGVVLASPVPRLRRLPAEGAV